MLQSVMFESFRSLKDEFEDSGESQRHTHPSTLSRRPGGLEHNADTGCRATWQRRSGQVTRVGERVGHSVGAQSRATTRPAWKTSSVSGALEPTTMSARSSEAGPTCGFRCCGWGTTRGVHTQIRTVIKATGSLGGPLPLPYTHQSLAHVGASSQLKRSCVPEE